MLGDFFQAFAGGLAVGPKSILGRMGSTDDIAELGQPTVRGEILRMSVTTPKALKSQLVLCFVACLALVKDQRL